MRLFYCVLLLILTTRVFAQQTNYAASMIPAALLAHASAVVRTDETTVDVKSLDAVTTRTKYVVTVLNKNGDSDAALSLHYDKLNQLKAVKGVVYNELGLPVSKISERDFADKSTADGYSLFLDDRVKSFRPAISTYPYTVEYTYEMLSKQTLFLPDWEPGQAIGTSVEHSTYKLTCKPDFNIRYKPVNFSGNVAVADVQGLKSYIWQADNLAALRDEPYRPAADQLYPSVKIAPEKFIYADVSGSFTNWQQYGSFMYDKLLKGRQELPPATVDYIRDLTKDIADPKLKAKKIYEYVQQKTRYVSVQIGIGGYQPFAAAEVDQTSYGDCKALVNYTQALLAAAGIPSYYILNMAGSTKVNALPDFASMNQFNHVILCLPFKNDTTWIDCTSKENPFGYLGDFTDDRNVVACTAQGGLLLHTPKYTSAGSKQLRKATFTINAGGTLSGDMQTVFTGSQYDNRDYIIQEAYTEQLKKVKETYPVENLEILSYKLTQDKSLQPSTTETVKLEARDYLAQNGGRYFFMPNTASRYIKPLKDVTNRTLPVYINRGYTDEDEITYTLPEGYHISTKLLTLVLDKPFGKYSATMQVTGNKLVYKRSLQIIDGTYNKDTYADLVDFYQTVYEADNYTLTMVK